MASDQPIGIFDSGVGGLTVLKALKRALPKESYIYLGDTARVPYGTKGPSTVIRYCRELAAQLLARHVKMLVVACNTASSCAMEALRHDFTLPMTGVIEPGAAAAVESTKTKKIAVLATLGTVKSGAYRHAIVARDPAIEVDERACPLFVPLVEEGWTDEVATQLIAERYLGDLRGRPTDTVVLGCTHYPLLVPILQRVVGHRVNIVDSAETTAAAVRKLLTLHGIEATGRVAPAVQYLVTDSPGRFREVGERFLGEPLAPIEEIRVGG